MGKLLIVLAALGLASTAMAQRNGWVMEVDKAEVRPGDATVRVTLSAEYNPRDFIAFAHARLAVAASEPGWDRVWLLPGSSAPGTTPGVISGGEVVGVIVAQIHFPPPIIADPTNPLPVWAGEFTVTEFSARTISLQTMTAEYRVHAGLHSPWIPEPGEGSAEVRVIPAPAGLTLLGLGGLAASRRRR